MPGDHAGSSSISSIRARRTSNGTTADVSRNFMGLRSGPPEVPPGYHPRRPAEEREGRSLTQAVISPAARACSSMGMFVDSASLRDNIPFIVSPCFGTRDLSRVAAPAQASL